MKPADLYLGTMGPHLVALFGLVLRSRSPGSLIRVVRDTPAFTPKYRVVCAAHMTFDLAELLLQESSPEDRETLLGSGCLDYMVENMLRSDLTSPEATAKARRLASTLLEISPSAVGTPWCNYFLRVSAIRPAEQPWWSHDNLWELIRPECMYGLRSRATNLELLQAFLPPRDVLPRITEREVNAATVDVMGRMLRFRSVLSELLRVAGHGTASFLERLVAAATTELSRWQQFCLEAGRMTSEPNYALDLVIQMANTPPLELVRMAVLHPPPRPLFVMPATPPPQSGCFNGLLGMLSCCFSKLNVAEGGAVQPAPPTRWPAIDPTMYNKGRGRLFELYDGVWGTMLWEELNARVHPKRRAGWKVQILFEMLDHREIFDKVLTLVSDLALKDPLRDQIELSDWAALMDRVANHSANFLNTVPRLTFVSTQDHQHKVRTALVQIYKAAKVGINSVRMCEFADLPQLSRFMDEPDRVSCLRLKLLQPGTRYIRRHATELLPGASNADELVQTSVLLLDDLRFGMRLFNYAPPHRELSVRKWMHEVLVTIVAPKYRLFIGVGRSGRLRTYVPSPLINPNILTFVAGFAELSIMHGSHFPWALDMEYFRLVSDLVPSYSWNYGQPANLKALSLVSRIDDPNTEFGVDRRRRLTGGLTAGYYYCSYLHRLAWRASVPAYQRSPINGSDMSIHAILALYHRNDLNSRSVATPPPLEGDDDGEFMRLATKNFIDGVLAMKATLGPVFEMLSADEVYRRLFGNDAVATSSAS